MRAAQAALEHENKMVRVSVELAEETVVYLRLIDPKGASHVLQYLAACAADGVRRPGSWEAEWLRHAYDSHGLDSRIYGAIQAGEMVTNHWGQIVERDPTVK